jgi:hypothetical protein
MERVECISGLKSREFQFSYILIYIRIQTRDGERKDPFPSPASDCQYEGYMHTAKYVHFTEYELRGVPRVLRALNWRPDWKHTVLDLAAAAVSFNFFSF